LRRREGGRGKEAEGEDVGFGEGVEEDGGAAGGEEDNAGERDVGSLLRIGGRVCVWVRQTKSGKRKERRCLSIDQHHPFYYHFPIQSASLLTKGTASEPNVRKKGVEKRPMMQVVRETRLRVRMTSRCPPSYIRTPPSSSCPLAEEEGEEERERRPMVELVLVGRG
jgi:hypothetical protein